MDDDLTLLERWIRHGADEAFTDLVRRHGPMVAATCRRRLGEPAAADDAAQAVFLILARKAPGLLRDRHWHRPVIGDWLHRAACHVAANHARVRGRRARRERAMGEAVETAVAEAPAADLGERLDEAVAALPSTYRRPIVLHFLEGLDRAETARALGIGDEALHKRLQRGLAALRRRLGVDAAGALAGIAPLALFGDPQAIAAPVRSYLSGSAVPPGISTAVGAGLKALQAPLLKALVAMLLVATVAGGGAIAAVHTGGPKPPRYRFADGAVFWWDSLMEWTFTSKNPVDIPKDLPLPRHAHEYVIWRGEVVGHDALGNPLLEVRPLWRWTSRGDEDVTVTLPSEDPRPVHVAHPVGGGADPTRIRLEMFGDWQVVSVDALGLGSGLEAQLAGLREGDLLLPISDRLRAGATTRIGYDREIRWFPATATITQSWRPPAATDLMRARIEHFGVGQEVVITRSLGASVRPCTACMTWGEAAGIPSSTEMREELDYGLGVSADGQATLVFDGTVTAHRVSRLLHAHFPAGWPRSAAELLRAVADERRAEWERRFVPESEPQLRDLAYSVLEAFDHPDDRDAAALGWPAAAAAPHHDF